MTALTNERMRSFERWTYRQFTLASGNKAWKHAAVGIDLSTGKIEPMHAGEADLLWIGLADETVDAATGDKLLNVNLGTEIEVEWLANGSSIVATDLGKICYFADDNTVTLTAGGSVAGRVWGVDTARGVAVQKLMSVAGGGSSSGLASYAPGAFVSNDLVIPTEPTSGALIEIPATAAASTVTLPASANPGTVLHFLADGVNNGHTVQYRDATGPTVLTTALTASKRHVCSAYYLNGKWRANAYVSP